jgi:hypothetical protein
MAEIVEPLSKGARVLHFPSQMGITHYYISVFIVLIKLTFVFLSEVKSWTGAYPYLGSDPSWRLTNPWKNINFIA